MKSLIVSFVLLCVISIQAQYSRDSILLTSNEWVNKDLDYLRFSKDSVLYNLNNDKHELLFDIKNKKLTFKVAYRVGGVDSRSESVDFKIKQLQKNKLVLTPIGYETENKNVDFNKLNSDPFLKDKQYIFYNRGQLISRVNFKKLTFHASTCFGTCPSMSVEIDDEGNVYYQGRIYTKEYTGNYVGKLSDQEFLALRKIVNRSQLYVLDQKWKQLSHPNDTPRYNYIVELDNGKLIEINTNDQHPILDKLSDYLLHIPEKTELSKTREKHKFSRSTIENYRISHY